MRNANLVQQICSVLFLPSFLQSTGKVPIPAVMVPNRNKPGDYKPYWTGKQLFSLIVPRVNIQRKCNGHSDSETFADLCPNDTMTLIEEGKCQLLIGLCSHQKTCSSLQHHMWENIVTETIEREVDVLFVWGS
jgi:hypothetical protein